MISRDFGIEHSFFSKIIATGMTAIPIILSQTTGKNCLFNSSSVLEVQVVIIGRAPSVGGF
jgi:hypothetical protein